MEMKTMWLVNRRAWPILILTYCLINTLTNQCNGMQMMQNKSQKRDWRTKLESLGRVSNTLFVTEFMSQYSGFSQCSSIMVRLCFNASLNLITNCVYSSRVEETIQKGIRRIGRTKNWIKSNPNTQPSSKDQEWRTRDQLALSWR